MLVAALAGSVVSCHSASTAPGEWEVVATFAEPVTAFSMAGGGTATVALSREILTARGSDRTRWTSVTAMARTVFRLAADDRQHTWAFTRECDNLWWVSDSEVGRAELPTAGLSWRDGHLVECVQLNDA